MNKQEEVLIGKANKLDKKVGCRDDISSIVNELINNSDQDKIALILIKKLIEIEKSECTKEIKQDAIELKNRIIYYYGYRSLITNCDERYYIDEKEADRTLEELLADLNDLVGLSKVKNKVQDLIVFQKVQQMRKEKNLNSSKNTLHLAFTGNPGTGKTTVARIVGRIYKKIGLLSKGHFVEVSRTDLIAGYQGQTALKVKKVIEEAKGGVLFIDEAYSITENDHSDSYGKECLTELTKALEDYREDLVVIVAGYTEPMNKFFESNPGLKSRFNTFIEFDDYDSNELDDILYSMCKNNDYDLDDYVKEKIHLYFENQISLKDENFANGRLVRNLYDDLVMNHARRVVAIEEPSDIDLSMIQAEDFMV